MKMPTADFKMIMSPFHGLFWARSKLDCYVSPYYCQSYTATSFNFNGEAKVWTRSRYIYGLRKQTILSHTDDATIRGYHLCQLYVSV